MLSSIVQRNLVSPEGAVTMPLGNIATIVSPSFGASRRVVSKLNSPSATLALASRPRAPCGPVYASALSLSAGTGCGSRTRCVARSITNGQPLPVDVPVQLIVLFEESELASGAIGNAVDVLSARQHDSRIADANAHPVGQRLDFVLLAGSVALNIQNFKRNNHGDAAVILVSGWKVAKDAALDLLAFDLHNDRFDDEQ